jgi:hypothetical protein
MRAAATSERYGAEEVPSSASQDRWRCPIRAPSLLPPPAPWRRCKAQFDFVHPAGNGMPWKSGGAQRRAPDAVRAPASPDTTPG